MGTTKGFEHRFTVKPNFKQSKELIKFLNDLENKTIIFNSDEKIEIINLKPIQDEKSTR